MANNATEMIEAIVANDNVTAEHGIFVIFFFFSFNLYRWTLCGCVSDILSFSRFRIFLLLFSAPSISLFSH